MFICRCLAPEASAVMKGRLTSVWLMLRRGRRYGSSGTSVHQTWHTKGGVQQRNVHREALDPCEGWC